MDGMYFMSNTVSNKVTCPIIMCPMMQMQQTRGNSTCMNYMYYNTPAGASPFCKSSYGNNNCPEFRMQHISNKSLFQTKMTSVPLSEIED